MLLQVQAFAGSGKGPRTMPPGGPVPETPSAMLNEPPGSGAAIRVKSEPEPVSMSGVVKIWGEEKGFGFITTETGEDLFVHRLDLVGVRRPGVQKFGVSFASSPPGGGEMFCRGAGVLLGSETAMDSCRHFGGSETYSTITKRETRF